MEYGGARQGLWKPRPPPPLGLRPIILASRAPVGRGLGKERTMAHKVILDTDFGSDIDDALALAYLLAQPECELLGLTMVSGQPEQRARLASAVCQVAGRVVPIYPGLAAPRTGEQRQPVAQQAPALARWPHQAEFPAGQAVTFLADTLRRYPGEVTLLTIGPLTNIAAL